MILRLNVTWIFSAYRNTKGNFIGIAPRPQYGERCSAKFINNTFRVNGHLVTDASTEQHCLIETEYLAEAGNEVKFGFSGCTYDARFGHDTKTYIAKVMSEVIGNSGNPTLAGYRWKGLC